MASPARDGPDVSVVIPTFFRERLLVEAVTSALDQRGPSLEVIVVDDSSSGAARATIEGIRDDRLRYVARSEPSGGHPARVRHDGMIVARGRYLHFLDDDDLLADGGLGALASALDAAPSAGVAFGGIAPFGDDPVVLAREKAYFARAAAVARRSRSRFQLCAALLWESAPIVCSACMIRRDLALGIGWDPILPYLEDGDFYLRAIRASGFVYVDRTVVRYRTGAPSLMKQATTRRDAIVAAYRTIHGKYRLAHGALELAALRALALVSSIDV